MPFEYENIDLPRYPHGAEPDLDDVLHFLDVAAQTGFHIEQPGESDLSDIERAQIVYESFLEEVTDGASSYLVARNDEGDIVGTVIYAIHPEYNYVELNVLAVSPDYQGRGVGSELLERVTDHAVQQGAESITLSTTPGAYEFYIRHGFEDVEEDDYAQVRSMVKKIVLREEPELAKVISMSEFIKLSRPDSTDE